MGSLRASKMNRMVLEIFCPDRELYLTNWFLTLWVYSEILVSETVVKGEKIGLRSQREWMCS